MFVSVSSISLPVRVSSRRVEWEESFSFFFPLTNKQLDEIYINCSSLISFSFFSSRNNQSINMSDEGLLITPTSSNKRSLTDQFVDYVKKSKCLVSREHLSSSKRGKFPFAHVETNEHFHSFQARSVLRIQSVKMIARRKTLFIYTVRICLCRRKPYG